MRAALVRVATIGVVTLVGAIVVDVGLDRVIQREGGLALAFSVSFVERVTHIVWREMATTPVETKKVRDGRSMLEKRSDITAKYEPTVLSRDCKVSPGEHTYVSWAKM